MELHGEYEQCWTPRDEKLVRDASIFLHMDAVDISILKSLKRYGQKMLGNMLGP